VNNDKDKFVWYSAGLHFECLKCGCCCSGPAEGYIWVRKPEIQLIAKHLNISADQLKKKYLIRAGFRLSIKEDPHTHDCVFLRKTAQGKGCTIYPVRPAQCRSWPFWPMNLAGPNTWNEAASRCPGINRGPVFIPDQIKIRQNTKFWWKKENNQVLIRQVQEIYDWLDEQLKAQSPDCVACGKCCDFDSFGHRLFVTTPEILFFENKIGSRDIKKMAGGRCIYQADGKCSVYQYRFAGCRIFDCKANPDFQSDLTETVIKKFKSLCEEYEVPYRYVDLPKALNG